MVFATGVVEPLADGVLSSSGPAWTSDGSIVFSRGTRLMLWTRGAPERELAKTDETQGEVALSWPVVAAGDRAVLFVSRRNGARGSPFRIEAVPIRGGARTLVRDGGEQPVFASADRVVFKRNGVLFVAPFDADRLQNRW